MIRDKLLKAVGTIIGIGIIVAALALIGNCMGERPWMGVIYPNEGRGNISSPNNFKTLEDCREWVFKEAKKQNLKEGEWDYDCGRDCEYDRSTPQADDYKCAELSK